MRRGAGHRDAEASAAGGEFSIGKPLIIIICVTAAPEGTANGDWGLGVAPTNRRGPLLRNPHP